MDRENIIKIQEGTFADINSLLDLIEFIISELKNDKSHRLDFNDTSGIIGDHIWNTDIWIITDLFYGSNYVNVILENNFDEIICEVAHE